MRNFGWQITKKILGILLVVFGLIALLVPFFPFAWVVFVGFELLGVRVIFGDKIKLWFRKVVKPHS